MFKVSLVILVLGVLWEGTYGGGSDLVTQMNAIARKMKNSLDHFESRLQRLEAENAKLRSKQTGLVVDCLRTKPEMRISRAGVTLLYNECQVDTSNGGMNIHNGVFTVPLGQGGVYQMSLSVKTNLKGAGSIVCWIRLNNGKIKDLGGVQRNFLELKSMKTIQ